MHVHPDWTALCMLNVLYCLYAECAILHADKKAGSEKPSDQLLLWAVEGLAGVVINGIPNNVPGTRALNTPKAVLWGQHDALLIWPGTLLLLCSQVHTTSFEAQETLYMQVLQDCWGCTACVDPNRTALDYAALSV